MMRLHYGVNYEIFTGCGGHTLSFDGTNTFVQVNVPSCISKNPFEVYEMTYELWFYLAEWKNTYQIVIGQGGEHGFKIGRDSDKGDVYVENKNGAGDCFIVSSIGCNSIPLKIWYHIAVAYNGTHYFLYCNGELRDENIINCTGMGPGKFANRMDIGEDSILPGVKNWFGMYDEVRGWSQFLTLEQLNSRRFRTLNKQEKSNPNLTFYYTFDQGEGDILLDESWNINMTDKIQMNGDLGGTGSDMRVINKPKWVKSECPLVSSFCILETKFGNIESQIIFKIYVLENNGSIDISKNYSNYEINLIIKSTPHIGSLITFDSNKVIDKVNYEVQTNEFIYISPLILNQTSSIDRIDYCISNSSSNEIIACNYYKIIISENHLPYGGTAGYSLFFDGINDYAFSEKFYWPIANYSRGLGGGPVTIEWWGLVRDEDLIIDNYLASGGEMFSIGATEVVGLFCNFHCYGRFGAHVPWSDGGLYFDYGWTPGVEGRIGRDLHPYLNKWTHIALVSGGKESEILQVYFDGVLSPLNSDSSLNLKSDATIEAIKGLFIGCWTYYWYCQRAAIDEFRIWNETRNQTEIQNYMNKKIQYPEKEKNLYAYYNFNEISNNNEIQDLSNNKFELKLGGCSNQSDYYEDKGGCIGNFENTSILDYYPLGTWSGANLDDMIYNVSMYENSNATIILNGKNLDSDEITLIFNNDPIHFDVQYGTLNLTKGIILKSPNYFPGTILNKWIVNIFLHKDYAGTPLEFLSYYLNDGLLNSTEIHIYLNVLCLSGRYLEQDQCFDCLPGSFTNISGSLNCTLCDLGFYQSNSSSTFCTRCPEGYTTFDLGATFCVFQYKGCVFKNSLNLSEFGIIFNGVMIGVLGFIILFTVIYYHRKKEKTLKPKDLITLNKLESVVSKVSEDVKDSHEYSKDNSIIKKKNKKLSVYDFFEIGGNVIIFAQLISYSIVIDDTGRLIGNDTNKLINNLKNAFSFLSFNIGPDSLELLSISSSAAKICQIVIYMIIVAIAFFTGTLLFIDFFKKELHINEKNKNFMFLQKMIQILMNISQNAFIPISVTFFKVYSCIEEVEDNGPFLDYYCELHCWTRTHISLLVIFSIIFVVYSILFLIYFSKLEDMKYLNKKLHLRKNSIYSQSTIFFQLMITSSSILLSFNKKLMAFFIFFMYLVLIVIIIRYKPYGKITKLNRLVLGLFNVLFLTILSSIITLFNDVNASLLFMGIWLSVGFLVLINVLRAPEILTKSK